jgi:AraC family transcriptional regulator
MDAISQLIFWISPLGMNNATAKAARRGTKTGCLSTNQQERLHRFIDENLGAELSLGDLAEVAGCSAQHLSRVFRRTFGLTPHQYLIRARIDRAKSLLRDGRLSLAEIATACGFADQSHFTSRFTKTTGMSPGRYRSQAQRAKEVERETQES